jgi:hypothetical protein
MLRLEAETKLDKANAQNARLREALDAAHTEADAAAVRFRQVANENPDSIVADRGADDAEDCLRILAAILNDDAEATTAWLAKRDERVRQEGARAERQRIANGLAVMAEWLEGCVAASVESGFPPQDYLDGRANGLREAAEYVTTDWGIRACTDEGGR